MSNPPPPSAGATVLLVNATDLDASREFGQASLIYSLEGSSQFRLNSRSGTCVCAWCVFVPGKTDFRFDCKIMLEVMAYLNLCMHNLLCFLVTLLLCTL